MMENGSEDEFRQAFGIGVEIGHVLGEIDSLMLTIRATGVCKRPMVEMAMELCSLSSKLARNCKELKYRAEKE